MGMGSAIDDCQVWVLVSLKLALSGGRGHTVVCVSQSFYCQRRERQWTGI